MPYHVVISEQAASSLDQLTADELAEWLAIQRTLSVIPYPQVKDRRIRRFRLADDEQVFLYAIPAFPHTVAYTVNEPPPGAEFGTVTIRAFLER